MELVDLERDIMDLRERTSVMETNIATLIQQQTAVETIAHSVQELALSLKELTIQTTNNTKKLEENECDAKKRSFYIWCTVVGGVLGMVITFISSLIM